MIWFSDNVLHCHKVLVIMGIHFVPKPDFPSLSSGHSGACKPGKLLPCDFQRWLKVSGWFILHEDGFSFPVGREKVSCSPSNIIIEIFSVKLKVSNRRMRVIFLFLCQINIYLTSSNVRRKDQLIENIWKKTWSSIRGS